MFICFIRLHIMQIYVETFSVYNYHSSHGSTLYGRFYKRHVEFFFSMSALILVIQSQFQDQRLIPRSKFENRIFLNYK